MNSWDLGILQFMNSAQKQEFIDNSEFRQEFSTMTEVARIGVNTAVLLYCCIDCFDVLLY